MEFPLDPLSLATTFTFSIVSIAWILRMLWRRIIKDGTETAKDRAEINIIDTMQVQLATLIAENLRLRTTEANLSQRLGRLEAKEKEAADHVILIDKLQKKLEQKDLKIEGLFISHTKETTRLTLLLEIKDAQIKELYKKILDLEKILFNKEPK